MENKINIYRILVKTFVLFVLFAFLIFPLLEAEIGKISLYNLVLPGRLRFPYSENPDQSYNMSLFDIHANYSSHVVSDQVSSREEFRVFVLGDSSVWGTLLKSEDTISGQLNRMKLQTTGGIPVHFYNLGYPSLSLTKDLFFLVNAMKYKPDMIIWFITLESFPNDKQISSPIIANNHRLVSLMINDNDLNLNPRDESFVLTSYWAQTLFGQRRKLADIFRLQLYGVMWRITGIDQEYPSEYEHAKRDFEEDTTFHSWVEGDMTSSDLAFHLLDSGQIIAGDIPFLIVNEPILISDGINSDLRYNFYYPIWAYDQYRLALNSTSNNKNWGFIDLWDLVPEQEFTNTAIHTNPKGVAILANAISDQVLEIIEQHIKDN